MSGQGRILGIGGIFFKSANQPAMQEWYAKNLGLSDTGGGAIEFHGSLPLAEVSRHLARAAVLVVPSIWCEALPLIAFDALSAGVPMVGSDIGGIPTIVRDGITGLLASPRDPARFAAQIERILADGALRARLSAGRSQVTGLPPGPVSETSTPMIASPPA